MDLTIASESGPLSRMTPMALRPAGVPNATIVSITAHPAVVGINFEDGTNYALLFLRPTLSLRSGPSPTDSVCKSSLSARVT